MEIVHIAAFAVQGASVRSNNALELAGQGKLGALWAAFYAAAPDMQQGAYGVYTDYESDASGDYTVSAGLKGHAASAQGGAGVCQIEAGAYLVFPAQGAMPQAMLAAWQSVWAYFAQANCPHQRRYASDFEHYASAVSGALYIGIQTALDGSTKGASELLKP